MGLWEEGRNKKRRKEKGIDRDLHVLVSMETQFNYSGHGGICIIGALVKGSIIFIQSKDPYMFLFSYFKILIYFHSITFVYFPPFLSFTFTFLRVCLFELQFLEFFFLKSCCKHFAPQKLIIVMFVRAHG